MIWFLDFERRFSSIFELEESRSSLGATSGRSSSSKQQQQYGLQSQILSSFQQNKKNGFGQSATSNNNNNNNTNQNEGFQLEHIDFQELYDDVEYKQLSKQSAKIHFDAITVSKQPTFCFFARILQIMQQSIDESRHLKNWGIFNNILDYINIERSVLAGLLIIMKLSGERVSFYHALYRFHRILLGIKDMRKRVLVDIDTKTQQYRVYNQINKSNSITQNKNQKQCQGQNGSIHSPGISNVNQVGKGGNTSSRTMYSNDGEVRINIPNQNDQSNRSNETNSNNGKKKSSILYDPNFSLNGSSQERKRSSALNSLTSSPNSPISPIFSESEREFLMVTYEIFYYTNKYSKLYLYDKVMEGGENDIIGKHARDSSGEGKNSGRSSMSSGSNQSGVSPTDSDIQEEETERNKLKQIFELSANYLLEQQQQYLAPRQKISSLDLDYNVNKTLASFTQKLSDGFKSTCSYSSGSVSLSQLPVHSHQFSVNITSAGGGGLGNTYSINEISLNNYFYDTSQKNNNSYQGYQDEHNNSYSSDNNYQEEKNNHSLMNDSMLVSSLQSFNQINSIRSQNNIPINKNHQGKNRERQLSDVGSNYLKSLKQVCKEQDDQVNSYLKMLLHRQKKTIIKSDVTPRNIPRLQVNNAKIYASSKSLNFGEASQQAGFQSEDYSDNNLNDEGKKETTLSSFSSFFKQRDKEQQNLNRLSSRSSSCGSNHFAGEGCQYDSNTSINEQDFEEEDDDSNSQDQNQIKKDSVGQLEGDQVNQGGQTKQHHLHHHHHHHHHNFNQHHLHGHHNNNQNHQNNLNSNHLHHHHHLNTLSKSIKPIKFIQNIEWSQNLSHGSQRKKSASYKVSLMQEVKEEKEDSDLFNSLLLDRQKYNRSGLSPPTQQSFPDKEKLGGIFGQNSPDLKNSITLQRQSISSGKSVIKNDIKQCTSSIDSGVNNNNNVLSNARSSQSPPSNNLEFLFPRLSQNQHESVILPDQIQPRKIESDDNSDDQNEIHSQPNRESESVLNKIEVIQVEEDHEEQKKDEQITKIVEPIKKISSQKESSDDESNSSSSSSSSCTSSSGSSCSSSPSPQKKQTGIFKKQRQKSQTTAKRDHKDKLTESIINYQNQITKQTRHSRMKQKKSHKKRKKSENEESECTRKESNSASKSSSQANRTFDTENSSSAHSSAIRGKKLSDQDAQSFQQSSYNNQIDISLLNVKNPLQRRGGIQVRTVQKHLTKSGKEFDTLGVVKPNFSLINEMNLNRDSSDYSAEASYKKKSFEENIMNSSSMNNNHPSVQIQLHHSPVMSHINAPQNSLGNQQFNMNKSNSLAIIKSPSLANIKSPQITQIKSPQPTPNQKQFTFTQNSNQDYKQQQSQSSGQKQLRRQTSQESASSGGEIKPKKRNSFFQKILNFFHKGDSRDDTTSQRHQSFSPQMMTDTPQDGHPGYEPPNMDPIVDKYMKRAVPINGTLFYKIKDVLSYENKKGKINSRQQSSFFNLDTSYNASTTRAAGGSTTTFKTPIRSNYQMESSIYFTDPHNLSTTAVSQSQTAIKPKSNFLMPTSFSDHFSMNQTITEFSLSNDVQGATEQDEQFEKELSELFEKSSGQTDYDLQDRKNNLVNLYGKSSNLRQLAKKSSLNYKELSIIVDEELNNENSLANRLAQNKLKRGYKEDLIFREINEEQFFTFPRESINFITFQKEQQKKSQQIRIQASRYCKEYQIVSNQKTQWTKLRLQVRKAIFFYKIYLDKKQFYPKKKDLKDFLTLFQLQQYQKQLIKDIERQQAQSLQKNNSIEENNQQEFDPVQFMQQSRQKLRQTAFQNQQMTNSIYEDIF